MSSNPDLKLTWATHEAAKFAVLRYHYSQAMPAGKTVKVAVHEGSRFIGVIVFGCGASPPFYKWANTALGLGTFEVAELVRIAMRDHKTPVSRILTIAMRMFRKRCPGIRALVSFADTAQGHHGGIYQASNWIYLGESVGAARFLINGKDTHIRTLGARGVSANLAGARRLDPKARQLPFHNKHKYMLVFDKSLQARLQALAKPYPKRVGSDPGDTAGDHPAKGGSIPTPTLQPNQQDA